MVCLKGIKSGFPLHRRMKKTRSMGHKPGSITHIYTIWYLTIVTIENHHGSQLHRRCCQSIVQGAVKESPICCQDACTIRTSGCIWTAVEWPKKWGWSSSGWKPRKKNTKPPASNKLVSFCDEFEARSFLNHIPQTIDVPSDNNQI